MKKDLHMHTIYCDGKNTPEEMVQAAIALGLDTVGLSGHSYTPFDTSYCMSLEGTAAYIEEVNALKEKYAGDIEVLLGTELDFYSDREKDVDTSCYDYLIGSVHYLRTPIKKFPDGNFCGLKKDDGPGFLTGDTRLYIYPYGEYVYTAMDENFETIKYLADTVYGGDLMCVAEEYYGRAAELAGRSECSIIGHLDLITKFGGFDEENPRYISAWKQAIDALVAADKLLEINTAPLYRGTKSRSYMNTAQKEYVKALGGKTVLGSDSHSAETICGAFERA